MYHFQIILHNPAEIPRVSEQYILAPLNQAVIVAVKPNMITTSNSLRNYDPSVRHCYFPHEKPLQFFKVYTQKHCEIECLRNFILAVCGCVPYHMPRTKIHHTIFPLFIFPKILFRHELNFNLWLW